MSLGQQLLDDVLAQKSVGAGHERFHGGSRSWPAAQTANFSRKILALCRISTGNDRCNKNSRIAARHAG